MKLWQEARRQLKYENKRTKITTIPSLLHRIKRSKSKVKSNILIWKLDIKRIKLPISYRNPY